LINIKDSITIITSKKDSICFPPGHDTIPDEHISPSEIFDFLLSVSDDQKTENAEN